MEESKQIRKETNCPFAHVHCGEWCELFVKYNNAYGECTFCMIGNTLSELPQKLHQFFGQR